MTGVRKIVGRFGSFEDPESKSTNCVKFQFGRTVLFLCKHPYVHTSNTTPRTTFIQIARSYLCFHSPEKDIERGVQSLHIDASRSKLVPIHCAQNQNRNQIAPADWLSPTAGPGIPHDCGLWEIPSHKDSGNVPTKHTQTCAKYY